MNDPEIKEKLVTLVPDLIGKNDQYSSLYFWHDTKQPVLEREMLFVVCSAESKFCKDKDYWNCNSTWQERAISLFEELEKREKTKNESTNSQ
jgi:hypothetical protein